MGDATCLYLEPSDVRDASGSMIHVSQDKDKITWQAASDNCLDGKMSFESYFSVISFMDISRKCLKLYNLSNSKGWFSERKAKKDRGTVGCPHQIIRL